MVEIIITIVWGVFAVAGVTTVAIAYDSPAWVAIIAVSIAIGMSLKMITRAIAKHGGRKQAH